jgi:hypothetical protein
MSGSNVTWEMHVLIQPWQASFVSKGRRPAFCNSGGVGYGGGEWTGKLFIFLNQLRNTQAGKIPPEITRDLVVVYERPGDLGNGCDEKKSKSNVKLTYVCLWKFEIICLQTFFPSSLITESRVKSQTLLYVIYKNMYYFSPLFCLLKHFQGT